MLNRTLHWTDVGRSSARLEAHRRLDHFSLGLVVINQKSIEEEEGEEGEEEGEEEEKKDEAW